MREDMKIQEHKVNYINNGSTILDIETGKTYFQHNDGTVYESLEDYNKQERREQKLNELLK